MAEENKTNEERRKQGLRSWQSEWKFLRDIILFLGGLAGVAHETIFEASADPTLLLIFGAMMGLPAFLRNDENKSNGNGNGESKDK